MRLFLLAVVLAGGLLGFQAQPEGTDASCNNNHANAHKCACARAMQACKLPGDKAEPDSMCKTFCRPKACTCSGPSCTSRK